MRNNTDRVIVPEATYLLWIDFSVYGYTDKELRDIITNKCNFWLDEGIIFGKSGSQFQRMNIATTKKRLETVVLNLYHAFK